MTLFLSSFLDERSSNENGGISGEEQTRLQVRLLKRNGGGVVHVKMQKGMLVQFLGLKFE